MIEGLFEGGQKERTKGSTIGRSASQNIYKVEDEKIKL